MHEAGILPHDGEPKHIAIEARGGFQVRNAEQQAIDFPKHGDADGRARRVGRSTGICRQREVARLEEMGIFTSCVLDKYP